MNRFYSLRSLKKICIVWRKELRKHEAFEMHRSTNLQQQQPLLSWRRFCLKLTAFPADYRLNGGQWEGEGMRVRGGVQGGEGGEVRGGGGWRLNPPLTHMSGCSFVLYEPGVDSVTSDQTSLLNSATFTQQTVFSASLQVSTAKYSKVSYILYIILYIYNT